MNIIYYLWYFKPNENKKIPTDVIKNNKKFINNYKIITPKSIGYLFNNDMFRDLYKLYKLIPHWVIKNRPNTIIMCISLWWYIF